MAARWLSGLVLGALLTASPAHSADGGAGGAPDLPAPEEVAVGGHRPVVAPAGAKGVAGAAPKLEVHATGAPETIAVNRAGSEPPHLLKSIRATSGLFRGAIAGGAITLELNRAVPPDSSVRATLTRLPDQVFADATTGNAAASAQRERAGSNGDAKISEVAAQIQGFSGNGVVIGVPKETRSGLYSINLYLGGKGEAGPAVGTELVVPRPQYVFIRDQWFLVWIGLIPVAVMAGLLIVVFGYRASRSKSFRFPPLASLLLLEPENDTYSLSRAQFILWMAALGWAYVFLFAAQGFVQNVWAFPSLEGFGATFLVSLATLIAAQATSSMKGPKGAGDVHPSLADLFIHGGVIALERVQQVLWTVISVGMFLYVVFKNYAENTLLPTIPKELLILMGISSVGYIGGKIARKAGPVINRVDVVAPQTALPAVALSPPRAAVIALGLKITGTTFSRDATILVDGTPVSDLAVLAPASGEFATEVQVPWTVSATSVSEALELWHGSPRRVVLVNTDSQRAEWEAPPSLGATTAQLTDGSIFVTVEAHHLSDQADWSATTGGTFKKAKRVTARPCFWLIEIKPADGHTSGTVSVDTGNGDRLTASYAVL